jgi:uncharacterized membrane protein
VRHSRHASFVVAAGIGVAAFAAALFILPKLATQLGANVFFAVYLVQVASAMPRLTPAYLRAHASGEDLPAAIILAVTVGAAAVAAGSLFLIINARPSPHPLELLLALGSVTLGWATIHAMAALHYAHLYWSTAAHAPEPRRGLDFPGTKDPGGYDFLYFAFVIGMTAQTSDTAVTTTDMRKINLLHAVVSFFFNAVIVAAAVNLAVSLGG